MTLQMVGEVKYAPSRDIVYLFPDVLRNVADRLEDEPFKPLHEWLRSEGITTSDLGDAAKAYCRFINSAHESPDKNMSRVLRECGWNNVSWQAQVAYLFYAGSLMTGVFFKGIRDAMPESGSRISTVKELMEAARLFDAYINMKPWRRWLYRRVKWYRRFFLRSHLVSKEV